MSPSGPAAPGRVPVPEDPQQLRAGSLSWSSPALAWWVLVFMRCDGEGMLCTV